MSDMTLVFFLANGRPTIIQTRPEELQTYRLVRVVLDQNLESLSKYTNEEAKYQECSRTGGTPLAVKNAGQVLVIEPGVNRVSDIPSENRLKERV